MTANDKDLRAIAKAVANLRVLLVGTGDKTLYVGKPSAGLKELERRALLELARINAHQHFGLPDSSETIPAAPDGAQREGGAA